jgi:hypothetical protein
VTGDERCAVSKAGAPPANPKGDGVHAAEERQQAQGERVLQGAADPHHRKGGNAELDEADQGKPRVGAEGLGVGGEDLAQQLGGRS